MKKTNRTQLRLDRETIRTLDSDLRHVAGGVGGTEKYSYFITLCPSCGPFCQGPITAN